MSRFDEIKTRHYGWESRGISHLNPFIKARLQDWHQDRAYLIKEVERLRNRKTCPFCGLNHHREPIKCGEAK